MRSFLPVIFGVILALDATVWACGAWLLAPADIAPTWRGAWHLFMAAQAGGIAAILFTRAVLKREPGAGVSRPWHILTMIWNLPLLPVVALWFTAWSLIGLATSHPPANVAIAAVFLFPALALVAAAVAGVQLDRFVVRRRSLHYPDLPPGLDGLRIAHLSDLHVGALTRGRVLRDIVAETNALDADLAVFTGDLLNMSLAAMPEALDTLRAIRAKHGLHSVEGNHDLMDDAREFERRMKEAGVGFMSDESRRIDIGGTSLALLGVRWGGVRTDDAVRRLSRLTGDAFAILLAHDPKAFDMAAEAGIPLTLAGHTHGGQLMLTSKIGFGPRFFDYWSGLYERGASKLLVSNGTGNWFPLRIGAPAEIILIELKRGTP